jgi:stage II sporulation protein D
MQWKMNMKQPNIDVGVMAEPKIEFSLSGKFLLNNKPFNDGVYSAEISEGQIIIKQKENNISSGKEIVLVANNKCSFELKGVTIGVDFHWEQQENQKFQGTLKLIAEGDKVRAINVVGLENYLKSVISSEMSATSSLNLLKAHAIISRSWLLAQIEKSNSLKNTNSIYQTSTETEDEIIRWYDREDHDTFDVCADDHCQRYQGITKIHSEKAVQAVEETFAEILVLEGEICDARFSKCCGGLSENFENVWEPVRHKYLTKVVDSEFGDTTCVDLRVEEEADLWIRNKPHAFCNTTDKNVLSQVLPDFDQTTTDFYRWKVEYSQQEISELLKKRSGIDFGEIVKMEAIKRGHSSRIIKLKITGTKKTLTIGKELVIRKWLSESHLYSSAFVIDHLEIENKIPQKIVLTGSGWGHGVGLCQIGAAVMGEKGYSYKEILNHYFRSAELTKLYIDETSIPRTK